MKAKPASMRVKTEKTETKGRTCSECRCGCWNRENLNYQRKPFIIYCEHSTYAHTKAGMGVCFDNTPACGCFEEGEKTKGGEV